MDAVRGAGAARPGRTFLGTAPGICAGCGRAWPFWRDPAACRSLVPAEPGADSSADLVGRAGGRMVARLGMAQAARRVTRMVCLQTDPDRTRGLDGARARESFRIDRGGSARAS